MSKSSKLKPSLKPSANWIALQRKLIPTADPAKPKERHRVSTSDERRPPQKKRKLEEPKHESNDFTRGHAEGARFSRASDATAAELPVLPDEMRNGESMKTLRDMILGKIEHTPPQLLPGKFLALDCEMVGVGIDGAESSLARVSLVNYHGAVQLDQFVRQRERVVDYRTEFSGVRETDMIHARPFLEVQKEVAELLKDRILVGHAVFNDLKALLLSHPFSLRRDTQQLAGKHKLMKTRYPALRKLVQQELGVTIQSGEHSSVTDARATMALYRLHRKEWDKTCKPPPAALAVTAGAKRKRAEKVGGLTGDDGGGEDAEGAPAKGKEYPGGGRKGVSSGLSTVVKRIGARSGSGAKKGSAGGEKEKWWATLGDAASSGAKGSLRLKLG